MSDELQPNHIKDLVSTPVPEPQRMSLAQAVEVLTRISALDPKAVRIAVDLQTHLNGWLDSLSTVSAIIACSPETKIVFGQARYERPGENGITVLVNYPYSVNNSENESGVRLLMSKSTPGSVMIDEVNPTTREYLFEAEWEIDRQPESLTAVTATFGRHRMAVINPTLRYSVNEPKDQTPTNFSNIAIAAKETSKILLKIPFINPPQIGQQTPILSK